MEGGSSPLVQLFPYLSVMLEGEVHDDIDRLLAHLLPLPLDESKHGRRPPTYAAIIDPHGALEGVRAGLRRVWRDQDALSATLDRLVAAGRVRAIGLSEPVILRHGDGLHHEEDMSVHALVEHRAGLSYDLLVPFDWSPIRPPGAREPQWVDRVATGRPHRVWPRGRGPE
jgi:hypothetical protein